MEPGRLALCRQQPPSCLGGRGHELPEPAGAEFPDLAAADQSRAVHEELSNSAGRRPDTTSVRRSSQQSFGSRPSLRALRRAPVPLTISLHKRYLRVSELFPLCRKRCFLHPGIRAKTLSLT